MYNTMQVKLNLSDEAMAYLVHQCQHSNSLINASIFRLRQTHFESCPRRTFFDQDEMFRTGFQLRTVKASYPELCQVMKDNFHYLVLGGQCAQQTLLGVVESFASFNQLLRLFFKGEWTKPRMPRYRKKGGLAPISFPAQALTFNIETGDCRIPISKENAQAVKEQFGLTQLWINGCYGIKPEQVVEVRIIPRNGCFYAEFVYKAKVFQADVEPEKVLGIDPGLNNWLTCVSNIGKSFILDGRKVKSLNQFYNKRVATLKEGKPQGFWEDQLASITEKRNRQIRDAVNKSARFVINWCLTNRIGKVVFGWNQGNKDGISLSKRNNQQIVQVPTARLKTRIEELCQQYGIEFIETEESYTSKASFIDEDFLPTYGEKPERWKPSGKRVRRGLYRTATGSLINADCNGAANILRKVASRLGVSLVEIGRASLTAPKRYDLFRNLNRSYRKRCEIGLKTV